MKTIKIIKGYASEEGMHQQEQFPLVVSHETFERLRQQFTPRRYHQHGTAIGNAAGQHDLTLEELLSGTRLLNHYDGPDCPSAAMFADESSIPARVRLRDDLPGSCGYHPSRWLDMLEASTAQQPQIIYAIDKPWIYKDPDAPPSSRYLPGLYRIPQGVVVRFPNGDEYDSTGGPSGPSEDDTTMEGSPVHQALVDAGYVLEEVER